MKPHSNTILIDNYYGLLSNLNREDKIQLIAKLSNSIITPKTEPTNIIDKFFGAFQSEKSAETLIHEIRESRVFNRDIESF